MPVVLKIDPQRRVVCSTFYGEVKSEDLLRHRSTIAEDPAFNPGFSEIVDLSGVSKAAIAPDTLRTLANAQSLFADSVLHVVVAPGGPAFGLARDYQTLARNSRPNLVVVRSLSEAYELLKSHNS